MARNNNTEFDKWFQQMLREAGGCFERDVLRTCREKLRDVYIKWADTWPEQPRRPFNV